jgi:hypothetical protein
MPTRDFILKPGDPVNADIRSALGGFFSSAEWEKMTELGARVKVSTTCPWPKTPKPPKQKVVFDSTYLGRLKSLSTDEAALETEVNNLNGPLILQLGQIIGIPMAKKTKLSSLRAQLINSLRSEIVWRGISGSPPTSTVDHPRTS